MTEGEMVGWHHSLNGHEFEQGLGDGEGQGSPACCSPWDHKVLDVTEQLKKRHYLGLLVCPRQTFLNSESWFPNLENIRTVLTLLINIEKTYKFPSFMPDT